MSSEPEAELLRRCREGAPNAWDALFDRHYAPTTRFIFQLAHDFTWEDAQEICQDVFLSVIKNLNSFHGESQFQTWVFRISVNKARDHHQRRTAQKRGGGQTPISLNAETLDGAFVDPPNNSAGPDDTLMNSENLALIQIALGHLGEPCREIIELRYFGDLSYEELSRALKLNPKTVSSRLSKCLDRLEAIARPIFAGKTPSNSV